MFLKHYACSISQRQTDSTPCRAGDQGSHMKTITSTRYIYVPENQDPTVMSYELFFKSCVKKKPHTNVSVLTSAAAEMRKNGLFPHEM